MAKRRKKKGGAGGGAVSTSPNYSMPSSLIPPKPPAGYNIPGGQSAVPGAPEGTVSTTPKTPSLMTAQAKAKRVKAKKAFGDKARSAFKKEYGSDWREKVYGKQAGKVGETYKAVRGPDSTPGQRQAASALTTRFRLAAGKLGVKGAPPMKAAGGLKGAKVPPIPGAPVAQTPSQAPAPKVPKIKKPKKPKK